ncbi:CTB family bacteriocin [aff. Roholtiella sp. LEGE 12411]|uniref:CTB family bacteriocin n=1 Tax=aff. Roholtiella sp. LEGE 12411 TaxID=1828822 RepID=UPI0018827C0A|nr:CTB family bacteriocin [aff. Roholtiella sp. LEGE 12411]MBE9037984.1 CTB family bacteriocin [aff. Roholtiella sp. LEGE 12411]
MSNEIKHQELSIEELDVVAGGAGLDQLLVKDFDASFDQASIKDVRVNSVGPNGAQAIEATQIDQTRTVADNELIAKLGDF